MRKIEVKIIRAVLKCRACGEVQISEEHANTDIGGRALVMCNGECKSYNMHTVIAKRFIFEDLGEVDETERSPVPPIIVDESVKEEM